ncbi:MAG: universal stress protein [Chitinophagaceae bacterium]
MGYPFPNDLALTAEIVTSETPEEEEEKLLVNNIQFIEHECDIADVPCSIQQRITFKELVQISASADLLLVDTKAEFEHFALNDIFTDVECPVCSVAATAGKPKHVIFAFDGSEGSQYAIRKFADLFPNLPEAETHLVSVDTDNNKYSEFINDWLPSRYSAVSMHVLSGNEKEELVNFLRQYPDDALVVMGAFGRSALSRLFHPSLATAVLNDTRLSLFLAHK